MKTMTTAMESERDLSFQHWWQCAGMAAIAALGAAQAVVLFHKSAALCLLYMLVSVAALGLYTFGITDFSRLVYLVMAVIVVLAQIVGFMVILRGL